MQALEKDPNLRYQTAEAFRAAVEMFAVEHQLRTSNKALADYVVKLFGQRPEPWEVNDVKPVTEDTAIGERGVVQPRNSRPMPVVADEVDLDDDDAEFDGEPATTVVPESVQLAARMMGDEPTATASDTTMAPLLRAMTAATGTATTVTPRANTSTTVTSQRRMKSDTAEDHTTVGGPPVFDEESVETTDPHRAIGHRAATAVAAAPPPPPPLVGRASSPQMGGLPNRHSSTHGGERPSSATPFPVPYVNTPSAQFPAQSPFETYPPNMADVSLSKFAGLRRALVVNRSSILIGGGAGITIIVVAVLVLRACGG